MATSWTLALVRTSEAVALDRRDLVDRIREEKKSPQAQTGRDSR